jgi:lipopolysaccharide export system protein LptC
VITEYLHIIPEKDFAETDKPVTITEPRAIIHAVGMELNSKTRVIRLISSVRGQLAPPKPGK